MPQSIESIKGIFAQDGNISDYLETTKLEELLRKLGKATKGMGIDLGSKDAIEKLPVVGILADPRDIDKGMNIGMMAFEFFAGFIPPLTAPFEGMEGGKLAAENFVKNAFEEAQSDTPPLPDLPDAYAFHLEERKLMKKEDRPPEIEMNELEKYLDVYAMAHDMMANPNTDSFGQMLSDVIERNLKDAKVKELGLPVLDFLKAKHEHKKNKPKKKFYPDKWAELEGIHYYYKFGNNVVNERNTIKDEIEKRYGKDAYVKIGEGEVEFGEAVYTFAVVAKEKLDKLKKQQKKPRKRKKKGKGKRSQIYLAPYCVGGVSGIPPVYYRDGIGIDKVMEKYKELYNKDPEKAKKIAKYTILTYLSYAEAFKYLLIGEYSKGLRGFTKAKGFYEKLEKLMEVLEK